MERETETQGEAITPAPIMEGNSMVKDEFSGVNWLLMDSNNFIRAEHVVRIEKEIHPDDSQQCRFLLVMVNGDQIRSGYMPYPDGTTFLINLLKGEWC